jgi:REP element-mobilizing transposase RayT
MGRQRRPDHPGAIFHLTARTLDRERTFTPALRTRAIAVIASTVPRSGARLLAVAIMSNHLHLVVQQGNPPLQDLMQPTLRRLAHLIQRARGVEGPVFWRPYGCTPCFDPDHARNAIAYVHLNPVRASLCADPADYPWTSHRLYAEDPGRTSALPPPVDLLADVLDPMCALPLFSCRVHGRSDNVRDGYRRFMERRKEATRLSKDAPDADAETVPSSAMCCRGDADWPSGLSPLFHASAGNGTAHRTLHSLPSAPDLADLARATLAKDAPGLTVGTIRGRRGGAQLARIRHRMIRRMHAAGHRNVDIARFLGLSGSAVSKVLCAPREVSP